MQQPKFELYGLVAVERGIVASVITLSRGRYRSFNVRTGIETRIYGAIEAMAQMVSLPPGAQIPCAKYVDWLQVQGFLDMAESALRAKNAANDVGFAFQKPYRRLSLQP